MTRGASSPFASWRTELRREGFSPAPTGGRRGIYRVRSRGPLQQAIGAMLHRNREGEFIVVLHVSMPLQAPSPNRCCCWTVTCQTAASASKSSGSTNPVPPRGGRWSTSTRLGSRAAPERSNSANVSREPMPRRALLIVRASETLGSSSRPGPAGPAAAGRASNRVTMDRLCHGVLAVTASSCVEPPFRRGRCRGPAEACSRRSDCIECECT